VLKCITPSRPKRLKGLSIPLRKEMEGSSKGRIFVSPSMIGTFIRLGILSVGRKGYSSSKNLANYIVACASQNEIFFSQTPIRGQAGYLSKY